MSVKGAIIGFGHIAANGHVPAYLSNPIVEIRAVCDSHPDRKGLNDKLLPGSRFYFSAEELLEKEDIDFVDVSTPPAAHGPYILEALSSGKHVLCEKPLVLKQDDLLNTWKMMKRTGKTVVTVHNWRYSPILKKVSQLVKGGTVGRINYIEYNVIRVQPSVAVAKAGEDDDNWRLDPSVAGGGILVDHGWHAFYLVHEWTGGVPARVECCLENRKFKDIRVEDTATVLFEYQDAKARLFFTWAGDRRQNTILIRGSRGMISVMDDKICVENSDMATEIPFSEGLSAGSHHPDWYGAVINEFLSEMGDKDAVGRNFSEAACCFNLLEHCKKSSALCRAVEVQDWKNSGSSN